MSLVTTFRVGKLTCHEKGFGFVVPRDPAVADLYIPRRKLGNAGSPVILLRQVHTFAEGQSAHRSSAQSRRLSRHRQALRDHRLSQSTATRWLKDRAGSD